MSKQRGGRFEVEWVVVSYKTLFLIIVPAVTLVLSLVSVAIWNRYVARDERSGVQAGGDAVAAPIEPLRFGWGRAEMVVVEGDVQVKALGSQVWVAARPSMPLAAGDLVRTGKGAAARYRSLDGSVADVGGDTMLRIARSQRDQISGSTDVSVVVSSGRLTISTLDAGTKGSSSIVETPNVSARMQGNSVIGVGFSAVEGRSTVDVVEGGVEVSTSRGNITLEGREELVHSAAGVERRRLPAVPRLLSPANYKLLLTADLGEQLVFEWESSRDARDYEVALATSLLFTQVIRVWRVPTAYATAGRLAVGSYYWRVTAIDGQGNSSGPSPAGIFRIAEQPPPGDPPALSIDTFQVMGEGLYLIEGKTQPGVILTVDDGFRMAELKPRETGEYRHLLAIPEEGRYVVTVTSRGSAGLESKLSRRVEVRLQ